MASGRVHAWVSFFGGFAVGFAWGKLTDDWGGAGMAFLGCWPSGVVLTPDLDTAEDKTIEAERVGGRVWQGYWYLYARIFRHRGRFSHLPGIGTAIRLLYLLWPLLLLALWQSWPLSLPPLAWAWAAGLAWSDFLHWVLDRCPL